MCPWAGKTESRFVFLQTYWLANGRCSQTFFAWHRLYVVEEQSVPQTVQRGWTKLGPWNGNCPQYLSSGE